MILLLLLATLLAASQPTVEPIGIGMAVLDPAPDARFVLLDGPAGEVVLELVIEADPENWTVALSGQMPDWFRPEAEHLDYGILVLRVISATDKALEVIADRTSGRTLWLRRQPGVEYLDWEAFLIQRVTAIDRLAPDANPVLASPDLSSTPIDVRGQDCFQIVEVRGEWARVRSSELCFYDDDPPVPDGWLRWRAGDELLVSYALLC